MIPSNLEIVEAASKLKMFSTLKNWQDRIKEKEPQKVILLVKKKGRQKLKLGNMHGFNSL